MLPNAIDICVRAAACDREVLDATLQLAHEIAYETEGGGGFGALFTLGRADAVLGLSQPLLLDPLAGHVPYATHITDPRLRGTVRALARLDGAFVIADDGVVMAACRHLHAPGAGVNVPLGLGTRHHAAAAMSRELGILAIVVSQSGVVRVFHRGELLIEMHPLPPLFIEPKVPDATASSSSDVDRFR
jgi:DNA integrity scanning protein DisA with diadenylate cyclase activity